MELERSGDHARVRWVCLGLMGLTLVVFLPVRQFDFLAWDDNEYVVQNPIVSQGITLDGLVRAFTTKVQSHWHPLTNISHMLDVELFGMAPGWHHAVNLAIHLANTILLFYVLHLATSALWRSALVALLFAIHPLHVESVAWISDRKDLLCTLFGFMTLYAYVRFTRSRSLEWYALTLTSFVLSLLSKSMLMTLPFLLLALDYWPLGRFSRTSEQGVHEAESNLHLAGRLVLEKWPFLMVACLVAVVAVILGTIPTPFKVTFGQSLGNAIVSYVRYLGKTLWPVDLSPHYLHPNLPGGTPWADWQIVAAVLLLLAASGLILFWLRRPYVTVGWLWFLGTLFPVMGWTQATGFAMADRYTYIPLIGLFIAVVWGGEDILRRAIRLEEKRTRAAIAAILAGLIALCMVASYRQCLSWRDNDTFLQRQLTLFPRDATFHTNLGLELAFAGRYDEATEHLSQAHAIDPESMIYNQNLVFLHKRLGSPKAWTYARMMKDIERLRALQERQKTNQVVAQ